MFNHFDLFFFIIYLIIDFSVFFYIKTNNILYRALSIFNSVFDYENEASPSDLNFEQQVIIMTIVKNKFSNGLVTLS